MTIIGCLSLAKVRSILSNCNVSHYNYPEIENYYNFPKTSDTFFRSTHIIYYLFSDNLRKHNKKEMRNFPCGRWPCGNISIISFFFVLFFHKHKHKPFKMYYKTTTLTKNFSWLIIESKVPLCKSLCTIRSSLRYAMMSMFIFL